MLLFRLSFAVCFAAICLQCMTCEVETQTLKVDIPVQEASMESDPPGHLKPLGAHRRSEGWIESIDFVPDPKTFYEKYVKPGKPLLMKGQAKKIPAYNLWTDEYLREKFGNLRVEAEKGKKETRTAGTVPMRMKTFLDIYKRKDAYLVTEVAEEMQNDFHLLKCMLCGGFTEELRVALMWFSSGGTKSVLHNDNIDNINCIMQGDKEFIMFDKKYQPEIERNDFVVDKGYSKVDVDKVDMYKFPGLRDLPWYLATMEKGDCMFIPQDWYHQVRSYGDTKRNLAVNIWFSHLTYFNETDCKKKGDLPETQKMFDFKFKGLPGLSYQVWESMWRDLGELQEVTLKQMIPLWTPAMMQLFENDEQENEQTSETVEEPLAEIEELIAAMFTFFDINKDALVTREELATVGFDRMVEEFPEIFQSEVEDDYTDNPDPPSNKDAVKEEL